MKLPHSKKVKRATLLCFLFAGIMIGLCIAYFNVKMPLYGYLLLPLLVPVIYKKQYLAIVAITAVGLIIGIWRGSAMVQKLRRYDALLNSNVTLVGLIADDPAYDEPKNQTIFTLANISKNGATYIGQIQVATLNKVEIRRGAKVAVSGKLRPSVGTSKQGTMSFVKTEVLNSGSNWLESLRSHFFRTIRQSVTEPAASIGIGYLVGQRASIPKQVTDQLSLVGLSHIIAVSGYNLTIIVNAVRRLLGKRSAYQSLFVSLTLLFGFVTVAGTSAPINRAVVVSVATLFAWYYGREFKPMVLLMLSGVVTAFANPLYIWGNPGWYLSFLAFAGILILMPLTEKALFTNRHGPNLITQILLETLCAQAYTLPYTLYLFGGLSIIAPIANVMILPLIPCIMLLTFMTGVLGMVVPFVGQVIGLLVSYLITLQLWLIEKLSAISWARADIQISFHSMVIIYGGIGVATCLLWHFIVRRPDRAALRTAQLDLL